MLSSILMDASKNKHQSREVSIYLDCIFTSQFSFPVKLLTSMLDLGNLKGSVKDRSISVRCQNT